MRKVRWAIDTMVQQSRFPPDEDIARLRRKLAAMPPAERWPRLRAILAWYAALALTIDQDGIARDYAWNVEQWSCMIDWGLVDPEQYELLHLTFLRSRTATGNSGRWQALTFSRRAQAHPRGRQRQRPARRGMRGGGALVCGAPCAPAKAGALKDPHRTCGQRSGLRRSMNGIL